MQSSAVLGATGHAPAPAHVGLLLRARAWLRRPWLDRAIARGVDRPDDRALALRQAQLVDRRHRTRLARGLEEVLTAPCAPPVPSSAAPLDRDAVDAARPVLTELVLSLRSSEPVEARGVALGWRMLTDPGSPIYAPPRAQAAVGERLWHASAVVLLALQPLALGSISAPL